MMWKRITGWLAFTKTEQGVVLFLVGAFMLGSGLQLLRIDGDDAALVDPASTDSLFSERSSADAGGSMTSPVNVNSASKAELVALPGIGDVIAERIIMTREEKGPFGSPEDLLSVKGITKKKLEHLKPFITLQ